MGKLVLDEAIEAARVFFQRESISRNSIWKKSKEPIYTQPRFFVCAYMRAKNPRHFSYPVIAAAIKRSDHTTVLNGIRAAHKLWGERTFVRLAAISSVEAKHRPKTPQVVHRHSAEAILVLGEANMIRFLAKLDMEVAA